MSLIQFHRVLIATAIVFCGGFAAWELRAYLGNGEILALLLAIGFAAAALALLYYLRHLSRFLRLPDEVEQPGDARD
jgi:hypothetical protein